MNTHRRWPQRSGSKPVTASLSDRLKPYSSDELDALLFSLDVAATVEPLTPEADRIRRELIDELRERGLPFD